MSTVTQVATTRDTTQEITEHEKIQRVCSLLRPLVSYNNYRYMVTVPRADGKSVTYPLKPKSGSDDRAREYIRTEYARLYGDSLSVGTYTTARGSLMIELDAERGQDDQDQDQQPDRQEYQGKRGGRQSLYAALVAAIEATSDFLMDAREVGTRIARVPYKAEHTNMMGLWLINAERPIRISDGHFRFTEVNRPHTTSSSTNFSATLEVTNTKGETKIFSVDREALEDKGIDAKLKGFVSIPHGRTDHDRFLDILDALMREDTVSIRELQESLGWAEHETLGLVAIGNNGILTQDTFIPADQAPFLAPEIVSPGNGYRWLADNERPALNDQVWHLLLEELNPANYARMYGKLGYMMRTWLPAGTVTDAGTMNFVIETVSRGSNKGKTTEDNYLLALQGADFKHGTSSYLNETDTRGGRLRPMAKMKGRVYTDYDRKADPGNSLFEAHHKSRQEIINQFADKTGGGVISSRDAQKERARGKPAGGVLMTGNYDHAPTSIERGEEAYEARVCSFVLTPDETFNFAVSRQIDPPVGEGFIHHITAWGQALHQWIMREYNRDKRAFALKVQELYARAEQTVISLYPEWSYPRYANMSIELVHGALVMQEALQEIAPDCFLSNWLATVTELFLIDRHERAKHIQALIDGRDKGTTLDEFVLDAVRHALQTSQKYVSSQQDTILTWSDLPEGKSLTDFGMRQDTNGDGHEVWRTGQAKIGHFLERKRALALKPKELYSLLEIEAYKKKYPLPPYSEFLKQFAETGVPIVKKDADGNITRATDKAKIKGKDDWFITIPLIALYPPVTEEIEIDVDDLEEMLAEQEARPANVTNFPKTPAATQQPLATPVAASARDQQPLAAPPDKEVDLYGDDWYIPVEE